MFLAFFTTSSVYGCGCGAGKDMLKCDYYVKRAGNMAYQSSCESYAKVVDTNGSYGKAAWYYLLASKPQKALESAKKALEQGHMFAAEYAAFAAKILNEDQEAKNYFMRFHSIVPNHEYVKNDIEVLKKIYKKVDFTKFR